MIDVVTEKDNSVGKQALFTALICTLVNPPV